MALYMIRLHKPDRFLVIKCFFKHRNVTQEARHDSTFCCMYSDTSQQITLNLTHSYFAQVQGQMGI